MRQGTFLVIDAKGFAFVVDLLDSFEATVGSAVGTYEFVLDAGISAEIDVDAIYCFIRKLVDHQEPALQFGLDFPNLFRPTRA